MPPAARTVLGLGVMMAIIILGFLLMGRDPTWAVVGGLVGFAVVTLIERLRKSKER